MRIILLHPEVNCWWRLEQSRCWESGKALKFKSYTVFQSAAPEIFAPPPQMSVDPNLAYMMPLDWDWITAVKYCTENPVSHMVQFHPKLFNWSLFNRNWSKKICWFTEQCTFLHAGIGMAKTKHSSDVSYFQLQFLMYQIKTTLLHPKFMSCVWWHAEACRFPFLWLERNMRVDSCQVRSTLVHDTMQKMHFHEPTHQHTEKI